LIYGIGIDLIEVARFREVDPEGSPFTLEEITYCQSKRYPEQHYAGRFAAKEAFFKALGSGALTPGEFRMVEVVRDDLGRPGLKFSGVVAERVAEAQVSRINLSLTHTRIIAAAVVVLEVPGFE